jgi:hypothetical protein
VVRELDPARRVAVLADGEDMPFDCSWASRCTGHLRCFIEFGHEQIGRVEVTFRQGEPPVGRFGDASDIYRGRQVRLRRRARPPLVRVRVVQHLSRR